MLWYPDRPEVPARSVLAGAIAEDEHDYAMARAWYAKLGERFHNYYYGYLGRERLATAAWPRPMSRCIRGSDPGADSGAEGAGTGSTGVGSRRRISCAPRRAGCW